ncbi:MAG: class I SAM-dependent methyltransferase [Gemmatimonadales bacterium]|nr:class I SAM-dependent methyltransferase [Gemmatimonadales bacterium]
MGLVHEAKIYFRMLFHYRPKRYWNELLSHSFDLKGVGHYRMSNEENLKMYERKKQILEGEMRRAGIALRADSRVLEVGCGVGYWTEYLKSLGVRHYLGNDITDVSVTTLRKRFPEYEFVQGDISETPLPENEFDLAVMIDVTQHITDDRRFELAMERLWKSIKQGGHLIITVWEPAETIVLRARQRLNRIEKARGLGAYQAVFGTGATVVSKVGFNDKDLVVVTKA